MTQPSREMVERAARVHEQLQQWLLLTHPFTSVDVIVTALTYEIARVVGTQLPPELDVDVLVNGVAETMKLQIRAHRDRRLAP